MNVWIVNQHAILPEQAGGTRHYSMGRELALRGHKVTIIASCFDHLTRRRVVPSTKATDLREERDGVRFLFLRTVAYSDSAFSRLCGWMSFGALLLASKAALKEPKPDVIIGSSPNLLAAAAAYRLAKWKGVPFVLEVRDLWPESLIQLGAVSRRHPGVLILQLVEGHLYRMAKEVVTLLPDSDAYLRRSGARAGHITWIPNGVDFELFGEPAPIKAHGGPIRIIYAGSHGLANHLGFILDMAEEMKVRGWEGRARFEFVGDGPERAGLINEAARRGLQNCVFEPPLPKSDIPGRLSSADAFIATLRPAELYAHGMSLNKIHEYMAAARPILFGCGASNNPVAEAGAGYTFAPGNLPAAMDSLERLLNDSLESRAEMGARGRAFVQKEHDMSQLAKRLEQVLMRTIAGL